jgi:hypothetical protein
MNSKSLTFDNIIAELKNNNKTSEKGDYIFKELTLKQQRKILNSSYDPVEIPIKIASIYNDYISESVSKKDDMIDMARVVTLETKPYFINELRSLSMGKTYYEKGVAYELYSITSEDLVPKVEPASIMANKFKINLRVPTLYEDSRYNTLLINALNPYKRKKDLNELNLGSVSDLYQLYEIIKFIDSFELYGKEYKFNQYTIQDRIKFLDGLASEVIDEIKEYIRRTIKVNEEKAFTAISETGEKITADINTIFFSVTSKKEESEENETEE